jgi:hypothetical protein
MKGKHTANVAQKKEGENANRWKIPRKYGTHTHRMIISSTYVYASAIYRLNKVFFLSINFIRCNCHIPWEFHTHLAIE